MDGYQCPNLSYLSVYKLEKMLNKTGHQNELEKTNSRGEKYINCPEKRKKENELINKKAFHN